MDYRITKMRENCLSEWNKHWDCLENHNQVCTLCHRCVNGWLTYAKEYYRCREVERPLNKCMFEKLVRILPICNTYSCS